MAKKPTRLKKQRPRGGRTRTKALRTHTSGKRKVTFRTESGKIVTQRVAGKTTIYKNKKKKDTISGVTSIRGKGGGGRKG